MPQDAPYARTQYNDRRWHSETPGASAFAVDWPASQSTEKPKPADPRATPPRREPEVEKSNVLPACRVKNCAYLNLSLAESFLQSTTGILTDKL